MEDECHERESGQNASVKYKVVDSKKVKIHAEKAEDQRPKKLISGSEDKKSN